MTLPISGADVRTAPVWTLAKLTDVVVAMRKAQLRYFRDRTAQSLSVARDAERRVDAAIVEIQSETTPALPFDRPTPPEGGGA